MPATPSFPLSSVIASNATFRPPYPTAIFAGIGQGTLEEFARHLDGRAHIIIVGRNHSTTPPIIAALTAHRPLATLSFLVLSLGCVTAAGLDRKLRVHYYASWRLLPLLARAQRARGAPCDTTDLGLRKHYAHNGLMVQAFAARHPALAFVHACPGAVRGTGIMASSPSRRAARAVCGGRAGAAV